MAGKSEHCQEVCHVKMVISEPQREELGYSAWRREAMGLGAFPGSHAVSFPISAKLLCGWKWALGQAL